jgi:hypothetical protein
MGEVKFNPDPWHNDKENIHTVLFFSRLNVFSKEFYIKKLEKGLYEINLPDAPSNWKDILNQYGKVVE